MPWYHIVVLYGPGHHSKMDVYEWFPRTPDSEVKDYWIDSLFCEDDFPVVKLFKAVRKLPAEVHRRKLEEARVIIKAADKAIYVLVKTPVLKKSPP